MATIYGFNASGDALNGTSGIDQIFGGELPDPTLDIGNDILRGKGGDDDLYGYGGDDTLLGGAGNDRLYGGAGNDRLEGGDVAFFDVISGGDGDDTIRSSGGGGSFDGGAGNDSFDGGDGGAELFLGGAGRDTIRTGGGFDTVDGGEGRDKIILGDDGTQELLLWNPNTIAADGGDRVIGFEAGIDKLSFAGLVGIAFVSGSTPAAASTDPTLLYDTDNGKLYLDLDGIGGNDALLVATFKGIPALSAGDLL